MSDYRICKLPLSNVRVVQNSSIIGHLHVASCHTHTAQYLNPQSNFLAKAVWICTAKGNSGYDNVIVKHYSASSIPRHVQKGRNIRQVNSSIYVTKV